MAEMYFMGMDMLNPKMQQVEAPPGWGVEAFESLLKVERELVRRWGDASFKECGTFFTRTRLSELFWQRAKDEKLRWKFNECERESTRYILIKRKN